MYRIANTILKSAYEHYKNTNSLSYYYIFPHDKELLDVHTSLNYIEEEGYALIKGKAIGSCYIQLTDEGISRFE